MRATIFDGVNIPVDLAQQDRFAGDLNEPRGPVKRGEWQDSLKAGVSHICGIIDHAPRAKPLQNNRHGDIASAPRPR